MSNPDIKQVEKELAKEAKADDKLVTRVAKTLHSVEKDEGKAQKAAVKADSTRDKAIKTEHKTAKAMNDAAHRHNVALTNEKKADQDLQMKRSQAQDTSQEVQQKKAEFEQVQKKKQAGEMARERRLEEVRGAAAEGAGNGPESA